MIQFNSVHLFYFGKRLGSLLFSPKKSNFITVQQLKREVENTKKEICILINCKKQKTSKRQTTVQNTSLLFSETLQENHKLCQNTDIS